MEEDHIRNGHVVGAVDIRDMAELVVLVVAAAVDLEAVLVAIGPVAIFKEYSSIDISTTTHQMYLYLKNK